MPAYQTIEIPIQGMDCAECTLHVQRAIRALPGVESVEVFLASEKAVVRLDPGQVDIPTIRKAVKGAGYEAALPEQGEQTVELKQDFTRPLFTLLGIIFGVVLFVVVAGEWLGLFEAITERVPWPIGAAVVVVGGYPIFRNVVRAARNRQIIAHTLMTVGVIAALAVGEWATAAVVVFFMRIGDYVERFTTERARQAVKDLTVMAPQMARLARDGGEVSLPVEQVQVGDVVIVRPGEKIPVDGLVVDGQATVDQSAITGESMPVDVRAGSQVFAATLAQAGSLRVRASHVGADSTFGRVIQMVEEAEAHRADVQRLADKFSAYYLPVVAGVAGLTLILRRDPLATAAVLVVACSCAFALATPIAMLASIGAGAKRGLMIKGGKYLELLAEAEVLLIDKTGTLTLGKPQITDILECRPVGDHFASLGQSSSMDYREQILYYAASAERYSEHPLAQAVRAAARQAGVTLAETQEFEAQPGLGVRARIDGRLVEVGSWRIMNGNLPVAGDPQSVANHQEAVDELQSQGKTVLFVAVDGELVGLLAAADRLRSEVPAAIQALHEMGIKELELLTGDNEGSAAGLARQLGIPFKANLLPEDKIRIVKEYQGRGRRVLMVGDGVNDAPALAQADVGIAMTAAGSDVAIEAAHVLLMRDDWSLVPDLLRIARKTMRVVRGNIAFTVVYNAVGLSLAALGFLPPIFAAAAQSVPDLLILGNSARLVQQK